jgi:catechol 2,3-dioxygenase-like lactoylglutathione lyase family enzyme
MIVGIDHFVLTVADLGRTLEFYERVLGMRCKLQSELPAALLFGDQKISVHQRDHTFEPKAHHPMPGAGDFCLITAEPIESVAKQVEDHGVAVEVGPVKREGAPRRNDLDLFPRSGWQSCRGRQIQLTSPQEQENTQ